ncbi:MAG: LPS export ABC transporter periplasmic protein LptC [Candidatus Avelusimicrobium sp.]|uniref:LPS export ABC transporter periplasmic protein LptC n=1 Tax=Candidatus Avelusimicrobium sp. TaxID=3048833 RepID=UPI003F08EBEC
MRKLFLLPAVLLTLAACGGPGDFTPDDNAGMQLATKVSIFESQDNQKKWLLTAESVDFADLQSATLKNPELLLKEDGKDSARVSGDTGSFDYTKKLVTIDGNARITSFTEDVVIATDRIFYDVDKNRIWSDNKTTVTRGAAKITARGGVETDSKLTKIELKKQSTRLPKTTRELQRKK